jgi:hypothetical protein
MEGGREQRQADQQRAERREQHHGAAMTQRHVQRRMHRFHRGAQQPAPDHRAEKNDASWPVTPGISAASTAAATARLARSRSGHRLRPMPQSACATTATATSLSPCSQAAVGQRADMREQQREGGHRQCRRQGEAQPGGQRAAQTAAHQPQPDAGLRTRRAGQELAQRHQIAIRLRRQPAAPLDELAAEIFQMRNRSAERREPQRRNARKIAAVASGGGVRGC